MLTVLISARVINATRQHFSYQLWQKQGQFELLVSDAVLAEVQIGDDEAVRNRLVYCNALARRNIELTLAEADAFVPVIATPEEILESLK